MENRLIESKEIIDAVSAKIFNHYSRCDLVFTNVAWDSIDDYNDISSIEQYEFAMGEVFTPQQAMEFVHFLSKFF